MRLLDLRPAMSKENTDDLSDLKEPVAGRLTLTVASSPSSVVLQSHTTYWRYHGTSKLQIRRLIRDLEWPDWKIDYDTRR